MNTSFTYSNEYDPAMPIVELQLGVTRAEVKLKVNAQDLNDLYKSFFLCHDDQPPPLPIEAPNLTYYAACFTLTGGQRR
jgi:hypothetical protein